MKQPFHTLLMWALLLAPAPVWSANWNPLPDSGLTVGKQLNGQNAQAQEVSPAYKKNNNQTVTDLHTGLMWINSDEYIQHTWQDAISYCEELVFAGQNDWRLPAKFELESIVDYSKSYPALNQVFNCKHSFYWSATPYMPNPSYAWSVFSPDGGDHWVHKTNNYYVRCVRDAE